MKTRLKYPGLALALALTGGAAQAADGWYVSGAVTRSFLNDPGSVIDNAPSPGAQLAITNGVDDGWGGQLAIGRSVKALRVEAELGYTQNDAVSYTVTSPISAVLPQIGYDKITRYMVNGYVDLPHGTFPLRPYLGGGIGGASVRVKTVASKPFGPPTPPATLIDDSSRGFAWQLMAGVAWPVTTHLALTVQYRWFDAGSLKGQDVRGQTFHTRIAGHNLDVGARVLF